MTKEEFEQKKADLSKLESSIKYTSEGKIEFQKFIDKLDSFASELNNEYGELLDANDGEESEELTIIDVRMNDIGEWAAEADDALKEWPDE